MIRIICFLLVVLSAGSSFAGKELALTIDDMPFLHGKYSPDSVENMRFREVLSVLKKHQIQVIGFVVGSSINERNAPLLDEFTAERHLIGNHTFTHPDLNTTSIAEYQNDIIMGQNAIEKWVRDTRYFRYPSLHEGPTEMKYIGIANFLANHSLVNVPVTIDNDDWLYNREYTKAIQDYDTVRADSIGERYLGHMKDQTRFYDSIAVSKLHRDIKHILLIHMTELNAVYLDRLLNWYEKKGWKFISPVEALTDPVYRINDTYIGDKGLSWLLRF